MSRTHHHYHYYAFWQEVAGPLSVMHNYDGIVSIPFEILTDKDYREIKLAIISFQKATVTPERLTLAGLTLLKTEEGDNTTKT